MVGMRRNGDRSEEDGEDWQIRDFLGKANGWGRGLRTLESGVRRWTFGLGALKAEGLAVAGNLT